MIYTEQTLLYPLTESLRGQGGKFQLGLSVHAGVCGYCGPIMAFLLYCDQHPCICPQIVLRGVDGWVCGSVPEHAGPVPLVTEMQ